MGAQNINSIQTRKMKGLKKTIVEKKAGIKRKNNNDDNDNSLKKSRNVTDVKE